MNRLLLIIAATALNACAGNNVQTVTSMPTFSSAQADAFAELALDGIVREFPNKPSEVQVDPSSARTPKQMHPAFYGSFDWHSSVHGHWMLVRLLKLNLLSADVAKRTRTTISQHLTDEIMQAELAYFEEEHNKSYERMYGWAWYLRLCGELESWSGDAQVQQWRDSLRNLEELLVARILDYLPKLTWPVRAGVHRNTAFALTHVWDYAKITGNDELINLIDARSRTWFSQDANWGWRFEPSGQDFLSSGLEEIDLMRRVLSAAEFSSWVAGFELPQLEPAIVSDESDGHLVHLAGLSLSRAWCLQGLLQSLGTAHPAYRKLHNSLVKHWERGLSYVNSGNYEGDHWLASFAVYMATESGLEK